MHFTAKVQRGQENVSVGRPTVCDGHNEHLLCSILVDLEPQTAPATPTPSDPDDIIIILFSHNYVKRMGYTWAISFLF